MPFKLKLKKSKQYSVVSKSLCVIAVKLLENSTVECILSSRTLGQECLNNVCQRLQIQQPEYFGLRYISRGGSFRWVDLERPLKKQVDKYAQEFCLYLGVMFHVTNVELLRDEVTRYYFFSHLKSDIIEGKLKCSQEEAIQLASYSLQAEFGDHRPEHHTLEYLKNFVLLPKHLALDNQDALIEQIILSHRYLQGVHHSLAEMYYILAVQRLDGYGEEEFQVKDQTGSEVVLGVSIEGINIKHPIMGIICAFKWSEIVDLIHHKRSFKIVTRDNSRVVQFQLDDVTDAKYIWKMCVQQHKFFMSLIPSKSESQGEVFRSTSDLVKNSDSSSTAEVSASHESLDELGVYHTETQNSEQYPFQVSNSNQSLAKVSAEEQPQEFQQDGMPPSEPVINQIQSIPDEVDYSHVVEHSSYQNLHPVDDSELEARRAMLPSYRQAPDYETAVRTKYGNLSCSLGDLSVPSTYNQSHSSSVATDSHLDVNRSCNQLLPLQSYSHYGNFIDLTTVGDSGSYNDINRPYLRIVQPTLLPPIHTYSTPELTSQGLTSEVNQEHLLANLHLNYQCKPPPPYPYSQRSSSSTPDLTRSNPQTCSASPDLVSRRNIGGFAVNQTDGNFINSQGSFRHRLGSDTNIYLNNHHFYAHGGVPSGHYFPVDGSLSNEVPKVNVPVQRTNSAFSSHGNENGSVLPNYVTSTPPAWNVQSSQVQQPYIQQVVRMQNDAGQAMHQAWNNRPPEEDSPAGHPVGPMMMAAMNGLTLSRPDIILTQETEERTQRDHRVQVLENKLAEGQVFLEFEQVIKKKPMADFTTSLLPENLPRNRFKDVLPYEENRVRLTPSKENRTGYINASHVSVTVGDVHRFYIAAQGPLANTVHNFWQMVWENNCSLIVMLTETYEQGREKCYPYWPQGDNSKLQFKDYQIFRKATILSSTFTTCSLILTHTPSRTQRTLWHLQYTDWPDHGCPQDVHGFLNFMEEIESVRRLALNEQPQSRCSRNAPVVMHCSAGVGRSGVVILCDILLFCLDHNKPIDVPQVLTLVRMQRMLSVQTLAQYKFVYQVLIQYLKNSRLI